MNTLTYLAYLVSSKKPFSWKSSRYQTFLEEETLPTLKSRLKFNGACEVKTTVKLDTTHLDSASSLTEILTQYKKPSFLNLCRTAGIKHHRVVYKRTFLGFKSKVLYHFINQRLASVTFHIPIGNPNHLLIINQHIADNYLNGQTTTNTQQYTISDAKGNKLLYEYTDSLKLTFINNNPEINQNINVALFHDRYSNEKYIDSTKFQLSL